MPMGDSRTSARDQVGPGLPALPPGIEWRVSEGFQPYEPTVAAMEARVAKIRAGTAPELIWLLEHPPLYTAGTSTQGEDLASAQGLPVFRTGRGGQLTYHGPGQRVVYVLLDLDRWGRDIRRHVERLEHWMTTALRFFEIEAQTRRERVGLWVDRRHDKGPGREDKIAAIGVRVRRWVTYHGMALNVEPDLAHFDGIVPCGIDDHRFGVTSMVDLGHTVSMAEVDNAIRSAFPTAFFRSGCTLPDGRHDRTGSDRPSDREPAA